MATYKTEFAKLSRPMPVANGSELVPVRMALNLATALLVGDVIEFGFLPEDHLPVDYLIDHDDLDTNGVPTLAVDFGILTAAGTAVSADAADGGAKWLAASAALQAAGLTRPTTVRAHTRVVPSPTVRRKIGMVVTAAAATFAAGIVGVTLFYRAAYQGA